MSGDTETGTLLDVAASGGQVHFCSPNTGVQVYNCTVPNVQVFFNEGSGRLECEDGGDPGTTTKYVLFTSSLTHHSNTVRLGTCTAKTVHCWKVMCT